MTRDASDRAADPLYSDPLTAPFWNAAEKHIFLLQQCKACRRYQFPPAGICRRCAATDVAMVPSSGLGELYSATTVHMTAANPPSPYSVGIVKLDEGAQLIARLTSNDLRIGQRVRLRWSPREGLPPLPTFEASIEERRASIEHTLTQDPK